MTTGRCLLKHVEPDELLLLNKTTDPSASIIHREQDT